MRIVELPLIAPSVAPTDHRATLPPNSFPVLRTQMQCNGEFDEKAVEAETIRRIETYRTKWRDDTFQHWIDRGGTVSAYLERLIFYAKTGLSYARFTIVLRIPDDDDEAILFLMKTGRQNAKWITVCADSRHAKGS